MEMNYKAKIKKLLALAESPVEAEAQAALLKSRELMAKHKLSERDLKDVGKREVRDVELEITCSTGAFSHGGLPRGRSTCRSPHPLRPG